MAHGQLCNQGWQNQEGRGPHILADQLINPISTVSGRFCPEYYYSAQIFRLSAIPDNNYESTPDGSKFLDFPSFCAKKLHLKIFHYEKIGYAMA